jgi:CBS domain-containing protein
MQCHEIMTSNAEFVTPRLSVEMAARKMSDRILGFLPVCEADGPVLGVVTDRDIALRVCAAGRSAQDTLVEEIMSQPVVSCRPYDPVARIERLMIDHKTARIVVTDDDGRLLGVVSVTDLAQHEEPLRVARVLQKLSSRAFRVESPRSVRSVPPPDGHQPSSRGRRRSGAGQG